MTHMKNPKTTKYQIAVDETSALYEHCRDEVMEGREKSNMWKLIRVNDWYIDNCFDDINNCLHRVRGAEHLETKDIYGQNAYVSLFMSHENMTVNLFKDYITKLRYPVLVVECIPDSGSIGSIPPYLQEIFDNYKAVEIKGNRIKNLLQVFSSYFHKH